jgi:hypothetical protein
MADKPEQKVDLMFRDLVKVDDESSPVAFDEMGYSRESEEVTCPVSEFFEKAQTAAGIALPGFYKKHSPAPKAKPIELTAEQDKQVVEKAVARTLDKAGLTDAWRLLHQSILGGK